MAGFLNVGVEASVEWCGSLDIASPCPQQQSLKVLCNQVILVLVEFGCGQLVLRVGCTLRVAVPGHGELHPVQLGQLSQCQEETPQATGGQGVPQEAQLLELVAGTQGCNKCAHMAVLDATLFQREDLQCGRCPA